MAGAAAVIRRTAAAAPRRRLALAPWAYLAPAVLAFVVWIYAPLGYAFWLSFKEWNMLPFVPIRHVGMLNYERLIGLPEMGQALRNTALYLLGLLPLTVALPVAAAIL
ncbi:MAG: sugar ABC transporter permease, partial [Gemmobacter sp.]